MVYTLEPLINNILAAGRCPRKFRYG